MVTAATLLHRLRQRGSGRARSSRPRGRSGRRASSTRHKSGQGSRGDFNGRVAGAGVSAGCPALVTPDVRISRIRRSRTRHHRHAQSATCLPRRDQTEVMNVLEEAHPFGRPIGALAAPPEMSDQALLSSQVRLGLTHQRRKDAGTQKYRGISGLRLCAFAPLR
jgi:hypothetical protein